MARQARRPRVSTGIAPTTDGNVDSGDTGDNSAPAIIDPSAIAGSTGTAGGSGTDNDNSNSDVPRAKRTYKRRNQATGKAAPLSLEGLEKQLYLASVALATVAGVQDFRLDNERGNLSGDKSETRELAEAINEVGKHYDLAFFDPKTQAILNLIQVFGVIAGTRFFAIRERRRAERAKPVNPTGPQPNDPAEKAGQPQQPSTVVQIPGVGAVNMEGH